jgi:phosphatidyl-myo-inositol dimannoside synthase
MTARLQVLTPVFPPAVGGIESLTAGLVERWDGPVEVFTLEESGSAEWDARAPYPVRRVRNAPRGGRRSVARLTAAVAARTCRFRPDIVLSMHVRCRYAAAAVRTLTGAAWLQYYHAKEVPTWVGAARFCATRADHGIAVSRYTRSLVRSVAPRGRPLSVIPPGISPPRPAGVRLASGRPTMLTVARLNDAYKGHDVLLDGMPAIRAQVPDVLWVVVGVGDRTAWLREQIALRGLTGHVELRGLVDDDTRDALFASSHIFALPSRTTEDGRGGEGFGIVYAEAAAAGLPVVAGDHGGAVDAVRHDVTGLLVDPADPRRVASAVISLFHDDRRRARMSVAARAWSRQFEWPNVSRAFQDLARATLRERRGEGAPPPMTEGE